MFILTRCAEHHAQDDRKGALRMTGERSAQDNRYGFYSTRQTMAVRLSRPPLASAWSRRARALASQS